MKKIIFILLLGTFNLNVFSQINLTIEGKDTTLLTNSGYNIPRSDPTNLIFRNNRLVPTQSSGYTLQCGDDGFIESRANNLDGAVISGNKLYSNSDLGCHGMMVGYSINYHVKYNYIDGIEYGIVAEGNDDMTYTEGGIYYNIIKSNSVNCITIGGTRKLPIYNNTFYSNRSLSGIFAIIRISYASDSTIIKNNIFYAKHNRYMIYLDNTSLSTLQCDYNIYYVEDGTHQPLFYDHTTSTEYTFSQWQALGFDTHSQVINPNFNDTINFVPATRLDYGTDLGEDYEYGLGRTAEWVVGEYPDSTQQNGTWQVGAVIYENEEAPSSTAYYVAVGGDNGGAGTVDDPWATFAYAVTQVSAGDTVYFRGGTYYISSPISIYKTGSAGNEYCFFNYPGETPVFDANGTIANDAGFFINTCTYVHLKGLTICNIVKTLDVHQAKGFYVYRGKNVTIENCVAHDCGERGFDIWGSDDIYITNCDSYNNLDINFNGEDGDGFMIQQGNDPSGELTWTTTFTNCRAWNNGDDGWDATHDGIIYYDSCWAFNNIRNGFKFGFGETHDDVAKRFRNCIAAYNPAGFVTNDNNCAPQHIEMFNNIAYFNTTGFRIFSNNGSSEQERWRILRNNISYNNGSNVDAYGDYTHDHNSWDISGLILQASDFINLDSTGLTAERQSDGSLPNNTAYTTFLHLSDSSQAIDRGIDVGLDFYNDAPDLGAFEYLYEEDPPADIPLVSTVTPFNVNIKQCTSGGTAISDRGAPITEKGVCWSTSIYPTILDNKTKSGGVGEGDFTMTITGLSSSTTYHIRAYATNSEGTGYGADVEFTTPDWAIGKTGSVIVTNGGNVIVISN